MDNKSKYEYLLSDLSTLKGVGKKTANILKKKNINSIFDLLWKLPKSYTDRSFSTKIKDLHIGQIQTVTVIPQKYSFPRIRNLPNRVLCSDETGKLECIFFNSYEGYVKKILPLGKEITISGKIGRYKNNYQITNPKYLSEDPLLIKQKHNSYSLTEGISEKVYNKIISQLIQNLPNLKEWHNEKILQKFDGISWNDSIKKLHDPVNIGNYKTNFYKRLAFDEIFSTFLVNSEIRKKIKRIKKKNKIININKQNSLIKNLDFFLTNDQKNSLQDINRDLSSSNKMFRLLQGDVGSGKTIVSLLAALNTVNSGFQVAFMAPTEILARQHYNLAKKIFPKNINVELISGKSEYKKKKEILKQLENNKMPFCQIRDARRSESSPHIVCGSCVACNRRRQGVLNFEPARRGALLASDVDEPQRDVAPPPSIPPHRHLIALRHSRRAERRQRCNNKAGLPKDCTRASSRSHTAPLRPAAPIIGKHIQKGQRGFRGAQRPGTAAPIRL